jgi:hypothetical protein
MELQAVMEKKGHIESQYKHYAIVNKIAISSPLITILIKTININCRLKCSSLEID